MMKKLLAGSALSLLLAQSGAFAYDYTYTETDSGDERIEIYAGAGVGLLGGDAGNVCGEQDLSCISKKAFIGYRPTDHFAVEGSYHDFFGGRASTNGVKMEASGLSLSALALMPVKDNIEAFGKLGFAAWEARMLGTATANGTNMLLGGGAQMRITEQMGVRGEVEYIGGDLDSTNISAGVTYSTL